MLKTPEPRFNSRLTQLIVSLENMRNRGVTGTTPAETFFQLKNLFHIVEALSSARIEGNHTTLATFVEQKLDKSDTTDEKLIEISNLIDALEFIDETIADNNIDADYIFELHKRVVKGLSVGKGKEGDSRPGAYRNKPVKIANSDHMPPQPRDIRDYMYELYEYINDEGGKHEDLLKIAIAHHRFVLINLKLIVCD